MEPGHPVRAEVNWPALAPPGSDVYRSSLIAIGPSFSPLPFLPLSTMGFSQVSIAH
jgi:hypothetical protein